MFLFEGSSSGVNQKSGRVRKKKDSEWLLIICPMSRSSRSFLAVSVISVRYILSMALREAIMWAVEHTPQILEIMKGSLSASIPLKKYSNPRISVAWK